ncbi:uncharacterized protein LOC121390530 [Gigantopelta aegis]|uniref:uncharacterized protein LOC121390530 n=1 Tax=Gigantopelta aegis TaxID=1735272 RepID=UPI001B888837|nr:uncharacterized protein LOC121390530 [Gigantopelta aegis]
MCSDESISSVQGLFLDGFVPGNTGITCNCSLQATTPLQIGISQVSVPEKMCGSQLSIQQIPEQRPLVYNCRTGGNVATYQQNIDVKGYSITLQTSATNSVKTTYCINFYIKLNSGSLNLQCYSSGDKITIPTQSTKASSSMPTQSTKTSSSMSTQSTKASSSMPTQASESTIKVSIMLTQKTNSPLSQEAFPVAAVAGGVGAVVLIVVVVLVIVVFVKRKRRSKHDPNSDNDGGYCNMDADPYKYQNTKPSGKHPGVSANQTQTGNQTICSPSDEYASIDDGAGDITYKPQVALKPNPPRTSNHGDFQPQPDHDHVSSMYAKVNKNKKPAKSVNEAAMPVMHVNELYAVVDKTKKGKQPLKAKPSGELYAVVNKKKKSGGTGSESKGQGPESEVTGDVYTEVRKPKKSGNNPNIPKGSPGLIYTELEFDENQDEPKGATGGNEKTDSVATEEDRVLYSKVC